MKKSRHIPKLIVTIVLFLMHGLQSCSDKNLIYSSMNAPLQSSNPLHCSMPQFLRPGDKVALLSPSYYCDTAKVNQAAEFIRSWGYIPVIGENVDKTFMGKYAGTDEQRLDDLRKALSDPGIKAIVCNRGGYGTLHFINTLPLDFLTSHPKWIIGYSDITTLHCMAVSAGIMSIHGIMSGGMATANGEGYPTTLLRDMLRGIMPRYHVPPHPYNHPGQATGTLVGGNLCTYTPLAGTEADILQHQDIILFIEEIDEPYRNIDRLFNMMVKRGLLANCRGIVLGDFSGCGTDMDYASVEEMLHTYLKGYDIPVLCGFPAGHGDVNLPLVMGATVKLSVNDNGGTIDFGIGNETYDFNTLDAIPTDTIPAP